LRYKRKRVGDRKGGGEKSLEKKNAGSLLDQKRVFAGVKKGRKLLGGGKGGLEGGDRGSCVCSGSFGPRKVRCEGEKWKSLPEERTLAFH